MPGSSSEELDKDCSTALKDWASTSTHSDVDEAFSYADSDLDKVSEHLGIKWETSKTVPFNMVVPYLRFSWDLKS
jgi:hypothetical protein